MPCRKRSRPVCSAEASLVGLKVPTALVIASIHGKQNEMRQTLQGSGSGPSYAGQAGRGSVQHRQQSLQSGKN